MPVKLPAFIAAMILPEAVFDVAQRAVILIEVFANRLAQKLSPCCRIGRLLGVAPGDEVERRVGVVHRHVDVTTLYRLFGGIKAVAGATNTVCLM